MSNPAKVENIPAGEVNNDKMVTALKKVLADSYSLYLKTQNFHWNVTGPHFRSLHLLFEEQYTDLAAAIDEIAELIRASGSKAPGTWAAYEEVTSIKPGNENATAEEMVAELHEDQQKVQQSLIAAQEAAEAANSPVIEDAMIARQSVHRKNAWMLASSV